MKMQTEIASLPNLISFSRICCIPPFVFWVTQAHIYNHYRYFALIIMVCAALSDALDGYLARRNGEITRVGKYLDPIADKLLLVTACTLLSSDRLWGEPRFPNWLPAIVVFRDMFIAFGAFGLTLFTGKTLEPNTLGKMTTFFQISAVISVLLGDCIPLNIIIISCWLTAFFTFASIINYTYIGMKYRLRLKD